MKAKPWGAAAWSACALLILGLAGCDASDDDDDSGAGIQDDDAAGDDDSAQGGTDDDAADDDAGDDDSGLTIELVEGGTPGEDGVAIARTPDGLIHIAAAKTGWLYLYHYQPAGKAASSIEYIGRGRTPRLAADPAGRLHLLYTDADSGALIYANNASGAWASRSLVDHVFSARLAVSAEGMAHLAVIHGSRQKLSYLHNTSGSFETQEIEQATGDSVVFGADIALDPIAGVQLAYIVGVIEWLPHWLEDWSGALTHASNRTGEWVKSTVFSGGICETVTLAVDPDGDAHIGYERFRGYMPYDSSFLGNLTYATNRSGQWVRQLVTPLGYGNAYVQAFVGADGAARLLYSADHWVYAVATGNGWNAIALPGAFGSTLDGIMDQAGALHAANGDADAMTLVYVTNTGGALESQLVDRSVAVQGGLASAINREGEFAVAYPWAPSDSSGLRLGWRLGTRRPDGWSISSPLGDRQIDCDSVALAFDDDGFAHVTYYDPDEGELYHATDAPGGEWTTEIVAMGEVYCSAIAWRGGSSGVGHIAYTAYNGSSDEQALYYAVNENGAWQSEHVDRRANCATIAVGADGPHLAYSADATRQVTHLSRSAGEWTYEPVEEYPYDAWPSVAVALDSSGGVHLAYAIAWFDYQAWQDYEMVHYAVRGQDGWQVEVVDPYAGSQAALVTDGGGHPHIAYYSDGEYSVRYAFRAGADEWRRAVLDEASSEVTLALDPSGALHAAYARDAALFHARFPGGYETR